MSTVKTISKIFVLVAVGFLLQLIIPINQSITQIDTCYSEDFFSPGDIFYSAVKSNTSAASVAFDFASHQLNIGFFNFDHDYAVGAYISNTTLTIQEINRTIEYMNCFQEYGRSCDPKFTTEIIFDIKLNKTQEALQW